MINSHRLLVRGHRIPYQPEKAAAGIKSGTTTKFTIMDITLIACALIISGFIIWYKRRKKTTRKPK